MPQKIQPYRFKGMVQDNSEENITSEFSFRNQNIRITSTNDNTLLAMCNEQGTRNDFTFIGVPVGCYTIDKYVTVWTTTNTVDDNGEIDVDNNIDYIYKGVHNKDTGKIDFHIWYYGVLNLCTLNPIEAVGIVETSDIVKVYWTDNKNQPRVLNIAIELNIKESTRWQFGDFNFDFVPEITTAAEFLVERDNGIGVFPSGVIQYCYTLVDQFGQETNICEISELFPIKHIDRGASSSTSINTSFKISLTLANHGSCNKIRLYSIQYTTFGSSQICRLVSEIDKTCFGRFNSTYTIIDNGTNGTSIENSRLLYVGGTRVSINTFTHKDLTMFYGGLKQKTKTISSFLLQENEVGISANAKFINPSTEDCGSLCGFHSNEVYRLGFQLQSKWGEWSDVVWVGDFESDRSFYKNIEITLPKSIINKIQSEGVYIKIRPMIVDSNVCDRNVVAQGILNPCMYEVNDRKQNSPYVFSSWFTRAQNNQFSYIQNKHDEQIYYVGDDRSVFSNTLSEIQNIVSSDSDVNSVFKVTWDYATFHSPDIELDPVLNNIDTSNFYSIQIGDVYNTKFYNDVSIETENFGRTRVLDGISTDKLADGDYYIEKSYGKYTVSGFLKNNNLFGESSDILCSWPLWEDYVYGTDSHIKTSDPLSPIGYFLSPLIATYNVFPWNRSKSLSNCSISENGEYPSKLKNKKHSITTYFRKMEYMVGSRIPARKGDIYKWDSDNPTLIKIKDIENGKDVFRIYYGTIDKISLIKEGSYQVSVGNRTLSNHIKELNYFDKFKWDGEPQYSLNDPVQIKYKSGKHLVFKNDVIFSLYDDKINFLPLVEIRQEVSNRFGGDDRNALKNNVWRPAGKPTYIGGTMICEWGDTYLTRHETLRTYPYTLDDVCSVTDIVSYLVETRVNINDCRIDRNKDSKSNLLAQPAYFNVTNWVYNQKNTYFLYQCNFINDKDGDIENNFDYKSQISWSLTKVLSENIDSWCNITLANILPLDGDMGS